MTKLVYLPAGSKVMLGDGRVHTTTEDGNWPERAVDPDANVWAYLDDPVSGLLEAIGTGDESSGLPHWHFARDGRDGGTEERPGVYVERQAVIDLILAALTDEPEGET